MVCPDCNLDVCAGLDCPTLDVAIQRAQTAFNAVAKEFPQLKGVFASDNLKEMKGEKP